MKKILFTTFLLAFIFQGLTPAFAKKSPSLQGQWKVVVMKRKGKTLRLPARISILLTFGKKQKYQLVMKVKNKVTKKAIGTWKLKGSTLTTQYLKKKKEISQIKFKKKQLIVVQKKGTLILERYYP